ncbi:hypothetical protein GCK72_002803 [Caenorhabditis remanei]|uniref:F-box domain-containing protein n=1 Tax=Caenorhabditis remanei TaxID=31234 RepID=A0A6A5HTB4_CAERE|nr:hypothetical protein GCK72_002803 [Caenorhabditis remanei]KAF1770979.1 hypothetical protein GCK72_002803 [Caenorhabditis remanei]
MTENSIELSDLPPEMLRLLVEKCDFVTRRLLRASSSLMYQVVGSTKLYIPSVGLKLWNGAVVVELINLPCKRQYMLGFQKNETGGTLIWTNIQKAVDIENSDYMGEAVDWFRQMCLQKNVTIGKFCINTNDDPKQMTEKLDEVLKKSEIPLKIESIHCVGTESSDSMWKVMEYCDKRLFKEMKVEQFDEDEIFELFGKQDEIVKNLEKIEINCLCNVSVDDVLSLNASVISLKSENFTDDLVYELIEKFTKRREDGSAFCIENSQKRNLDLETIPPGFKETDSTKRFKEYRNELINTNHPTVYLRVSEDRVVLQIGDTKKANFWMEDESDSETSDDSDSSSGSDSDSDANEYASD